ncbi:hypothetical protein C8J57DRAFT_591623 [Mycena rebaudengoi]|nr:hypothetical protein C8J57DRAFT_591623 [Mycena rebaudengoi]
MRLSRSSALLVLSWCLASSVAAPLTQSGSSSASHTSSASGSVPSVNDTQVVAAIANALSHLPAVLPPTVKDQLNSTLSNLSTGALDRWVTAEPIGLTRLGSDNPTESNADLTEFVNVAFTDDPTVPSRDTWVDTYIEFLLEAGETNTTDAQEQKIYDDFSNATSAFAIAQVKLVKAYEAANPDNITYVGVNIYNASRIPALSLKAIETWGSNGNGSYSKDDFEDYKQKNVTLGKATETFNNLREAVQMAFYGHQYKISLTEAPSVFNLSMVVGGEIGTPSAAVVPAWGATMINNTLIGEADAKEVKANATDKPAASAAVPSASAAPRAARAPSDPVDRRGLGVIKTVAKNSTDPLGEVPDTPLKGNLYLFSVTPGLWADQLGDYIRFAAKERPEVLKKYFGGKDGMGPIGRMWTHLAVISTDDPKTTGLDSVQYLGKVWDVVPALKDI